MFTNIGLVEHVKKAYDDGWKYVWGTIGQVLTDSIIAQKQAQYPEEINKNLALIKSYVGKRTVDCVNLIKSYLWWDKKKNDAVYDVKYDKYEGTWMSADGAFNKATEKGDISTIPEISGICVRFPGHIGVYIGNGEVIEARGTKYGVVKTKLVDRPWTHWLKYPGIEYLAEEMNLVKFQTAAKYIDVYKGEVDNKPGKLTKAAAEEFLKIVLEILKLHDPRELQIEIAQLTAEKAQLKNDIRLVKEIVNKH